jgi:hypothetical protein
LILKKSGITPMTVPPPFKTPSATVPISPNSNRHKQVQFYVANVVREGLLATWKYYRFRHLNRKNCNPFHFNQWFSICIPLQFAVYKIEPNLKIIYFTSTPILKLFNPLDAFIHHGIVIFKWLAKCVVIFG